MKRIETAIAVVVFGLAGLCLLRLGIAVLTGGIR